ncbi:pyridoxamine 5'-phosphate oxidase family protein [Pseudonocardiaceae bacterium YIM PH 21723]|nr:pyridoxamine 5'-phosphate oxidase family protein [Pseudonocardiaceae bacterium YIM PH 21723]
MEIVTTVEELEQVIGVPKGNALDKERDRLHELDEQWIANSRFCVIGTADAHGGCTVSPKGDPAGFTHVLDEKTIVIPDRPGNRRVDALRDILVNPQVGLLFLIPGRTDTLRVNGRARLVKDGPFFDELTVKGHRPQIAILVEVEEVFYHCSKAFLRSELWKPETWEPTKMPRRSIIARELEANGRSLEELDRHYAPENYNKGLYNQVH